MSKRSKVIFDSQNPKI